MSKNNDDDHDENDEAGDSFALNLEAIKKDDESRIASLKDGGAVRPTSLGGPPHPSSLGGGHKSGGKPNRRTSLLSMMLSNKAAQAQASSGAFSGDQGSPRRQASGKQRTDSNLSAHSLGANNPVTKVVSQAMSAMERRRSSILTRVGFGGSSSIPQAAPRLSADVREMLAEQAKLRPTSEPVPRPIAGSVSSNAPRELVVAAKSPEDKAWEERWTIDEMPYYFNKMTQAVTWDKPDALKTIEELEREEGNWTWVPHPVNVWQAARIVRKTPNGDTIVKTLTDGRTLTVPASGKMKDALTNGRDQVVPLWHLSKSSLYLLEDDLVALDDPNEALILHNLR